MDTLLVLIVIGVWVYAIIDVLVTDSASVRNLPKWAWALLVIFTGPFLIGPVLWLFLGRPHRVSDVGERPTGGFINRTPRQPAPRRVRPPSRAERATEEAELRARIAERDRMLAEWAEEDRRQGRIDYSANPEGPGAG